MAEASFRLNDTSVDPVPRIDLLTELLIKNRTSVLFVGEGDFSFTVAFAVLREHEESDSSVSSDSSDSIDSSDGSVSTDHNPGTWDGIIATTLDHKIPTFSDVVDICKTRCYYSDLLAIEAPPKEAWRSGINGCWIPKPLMKAEVIWFQCPWISWDEGPTATGDLIERFLLNTSPNMGAGAYVCVGITTLRDYVERYGLGRILGDKHNGGNSITRVTEVYDFKGADNTLIKRVLDFGYHHEGIKDIHDYIRHYHTTLVFRKK